MEDHNNLIVVASDDSMIRCWQLNGGNQFQPTNPIVNDEPV
jgi:hypothetical protein